MASSSSTANMVDEHCFRTMFNQNIFEELVCRKNVTPEVTFDLEDDEYPGIKEKMALRGWRRLASPRTKISKLLIQEFYANAVHSDEEMEQAEQHPYKSYVRGVEVDFSPKNIRRVLRFREQTPGAETDYTTWQNSDQRLYEVVQDLCIPGATWRLSSGQPQQQGFHVINEQLDGMQLQQQQFFENMQSTQAQYLEELKMVKERQDELWNNTNKFHHQIRKEQDMLAREIQEVKKFQVNQTLTGNRKEPMEKLEQTMGLQQKEMTEIKKQLKEWTRHAFSRDAYCCWAHQQANPNLTDDA
ncbi:hypothetical protein PIB30_070092 [Stylosanthes scabra]|uniref:Putative plant transposon protein domain-containing protein n=1 Tax=Stylosanthes scabra TaxID=79078 RepID=A0ABU6SNH4_9FABA|nr:hypothetical protein [Stylosanthes scabra]